MQSEESDREAFRQDVVALARQINADIAARRAARAVREAAINKELSDLRRQIREQNEREAKNLQERSDDDLAVKTVPSNTTAEQGTDGEKDESHESNMATRGEIAEPEETTTGHSLSNRERLEIALADAFSVLAKMASLRAKKLSVFAGNARASTQEPNSSSSRDNVPGQLEEQDGAL